MTSSVEKILRNSNVEGVFHTHVSMVQPKGKFSFNTTGIENFWDAYCETINNKENCILGVAEKPQHYLPVLADVDLKVKDENIDFDEHLYTEKQCSQVIEIYQSVLRNIVSDCTDDNLLCVLLEKPVYYIETGETTYVKNGFHLHFPNTFLSKVDQEVHLIPRIQESIKNMQTFKDLGIEDSSTVIDKACCKVPWLMYGSRKSEDMDPYVITKIVNSQGYDLTIDQAFKDYIIYDIDEKIIKTQNRITEYLPRILSIIPCGRKTHEVKNNLEPLLKEKIKETNKKEHKFIPTNVTDALKISSRLLPMIADWRSENYTEWMTIGWCLYNIGEGSSQALELWLDFSSRCEEKYDEASCIYQWERMVKKEYSLGTLYHFAKIDSPTLYKEFKKETAQEHVRNSLNGSHNDIAKLLYNDYMNEFKCASIAGKIWYQFKNHRWEEIEEGIFLREKISATKDEGGGLVSLFTEKGSEIFNKLATIQDKSEEAMYQAQLKQVQKIIANLKSSPYKNNIMKEAMEVFYDRRFKDKLNQNPNLIGFNNGIYDLKECKFRDGIPEDFISKCVPIDYKEYEESDEEVQNVIEFLQKVFPDSSIRNYFLDTYSDIFIGGNTQKKVYLWTGEGDNGKSITQSFFEKMLGELSIKFNTQYFTGKKTSTGSANPELARAAPPVRHATMEEPDADEQLNIGELKKLSGGDSYWARDLFEKGKSTREVFPMFTLTFICNKLPKLKYSDKATWNRLRVIPFEATFVEPGQPCPTTLEEQILEKRFPMDKGFGAKIPGMVGAFAWYLLKWRQKVTNRNEPEKVKEATAIYRRQNDIYRQFIQESITEDINSYLSLSELYVQFKEWYKEGWSNMSVPIKNEVKEYFEKLWGNTERGYRWKGFRIRTLDEDIDDGSVIVLEKDDLVNYDDNGSSLPPM